ncbi:putative histone acetyltransferase [Sarocladium strictum]
MASVAKAAAACAISRIDSHDALQKHLPALRSLLQECVNDDPNMSSLGFLAPLTADAADEYWLSLSESITGPKPITVLLIAEANGQILATAQVARIPKETHDFRGEVRKLLVRTTTRGSGLGRRMMSELERVALEEMKLDTLSLDTDARTPAREFYQKLGWNEWGVFPQYAKSANGERHDCAFFCKRLDA